MVNRPSTTEFSALLRSDEFRDLGRELELTPAGADRLALGLRWARERGRPVRVSRARFDNVSRPDVTSCLIHAEAEAKLADVEAALDTAQLTLGPLSPGARELTVAQWLCGPHAGLRAVPGGRLETAALTIEAVLWTGEVYRSHASPRAAAGPDLDYAFLGAGDAVGLLTSALLRAFSKPTTDDRVGVTLPDPASAAAILHDALGHEARPASAELALVDGHAVLTATFSDLAFRAHRDAARLREAAALHGATTREAVPVQSERELTHEFEVSWEALPGLLELCFPHRVGIHRIARESVVVVSSIALNGDGVVPLDGPASQPAWLQALAREMGGAR
ncbi:MAG: FAD-binding oxidoreductase [Deltaproteobacteria bacterium]|nr:FAD-binding oxidoreductase [Deltaproteobacteria bacterium]